VQNFKGRLNQTAKTRRIAPLGMNARQATAGQRSEKIGNADDQQTTGGNKQNFEANNTRPHGGAMGERPQGMQRRSLGSR
jgi:hypothetical protein